MSKIFLQIKLASLAEEAKIIRRKEQKFKKWISRTVSFASPLLEEEQKKLNEKGWEIKFIPDNPLKKPMTEKEREEYRKNVWNQKARIRKLNRQANPDLRYSLWQHRVFKVRPEARAAHLALGYLKCKPYLQIEHKCHPTNNLTFEDIKTIWKNIVKFGAIEDNKEQKVLFVSWFDEAESAIEAKKLIL